ncbi:UDP-2,3-diacylglucosamine hydrolase [Malaciobacter halophilus]|uniref:UDP-2,3-diacylglucosamine hydrolase n=1 Tax=Malaciobacter halophilus TaxID=197482 RepID=A0A2N1J3C7_9BACT|nr:metallophosphoesterase [Malaciobacter halophilus]AXH09146.1 UDP-2,3-diacylglucosamine hydrolase [Malaciobacter halophilus]PKI81058.1 UDP-2,3-diacylglucosamine hydrolase [Malaciobacter halophilus]
MHLNIQDGAIFVADSHYNETNQEFLIFLEKLKSEKIKTKQLFLMGDMFDFISSESTYFVKRNQKLIDIINELSFKMQIVYLEGNHDYNMKPLFKNIYVVKREDQAIFMKYKNKKLALSHGDNFTPILYNIYCKIIRNHMLLKFLNSIDYNNFISKKIYYTLMKKNICHNFNAFEHLAKKRVSFFEADIIIEGHFHQGKEYIFDEKRYVNIPSLCCSKEYTVLNDNKFEKVKL